MSDDYFESVNAAPDTNPTEGGATLTLAAIETLTGISYVTLQRYAQAHGDRLPHEGEGRNRKYYPEAVDVFREIREENQTKKTGPRVKREKEITVETNSMRRQAAAKKAQAKKKSRVSRSQATVAPPAPPAIIQPDPATLAYRRAQIMMELQTVEKILKPILEEQARLQGSLTELDLAAVWPTS